MLRLDAKRKGVIGLTQVYLDWPKSAIPFVQHIMHSPANRMPKPPAAVARPKTRTVGGLPAYYVFSPVVPFLGTRRTFMPNITFSTLALGQACIQCLIPDKAN